MQKGGIIMKLNNIVENDEGPVNWNNVEPQTTEEKYAQALKQEAAMRHQKDVFREKVEPFLPHLIRSWKPDKFTSPVTHKTRFNHYWYGLPEGTPNGEQMWKTFKFYTDRYEAARKMEGRYNRLAIQLKKVSRTETFNDLKYKVPAEKLSSNQVPRRIYYTKDKYFNNPYWDREDVISRYAGTPGHFEEITQPERNMLVELNRTLTRNGLDGLSKLYGSTKRIGAKHQENRFVVLGANGRVIWKHIGGNQCYVDGKKISMSLMTNPKEFEKQQAILGYLKVYKDIGGV